MKLSIIIPVYNEERTIDIMLSKLIQTKLPIGKEIIIVNDGSTDNSDHIIQEFIKKNKNKEIKYYKKQNGGKGSALRLGFEKATGDILTIQDADLEYDSEDYNLLIKPILNRDYKAVYGSRYLSQKGHLTFQIHKFGNSMLSLITSIIYLQKLTDMETCYKMFTREVYDKLNLKSNDFMIEPEITAKILKAEYKIKEIPISYYSRDFNEGKKITWKDGMKALFTLIKYRFSD